VSNPVDWTNVTAIAAELVDVPIAAQTIVLDYVNEALNESMFSTAALKLARIYLAAHIGTSSLPGGGTATGAVVSESVGGISRTYDAITAAADGSGFDATTYGTTFRFLIRTSKARLPRVI